MVYYNYELLCTCNIHNIQTIIDTPTCRYFWWQMFNDNDNDDNEFPFFNIDIMQCNVVSMIYRLCAF